jgi:hypothetical protein
MWYEDLFIIFITLKSACVWMIILIDRHIFFVKTKSVTPILWHIQSKGRAQRAKCTYGASVHGQANYTDRWARDKS